MEWLKMELLREYVRSLLGSRRVLTESGDRGFLYEQELISALERGGIEVAPPAGNNPTISDLGFNVDGIDVGAEVKLSWTDNLGSIRKENFLSLTWDGVRFEYEVNPEGPMKDVVELVMTAMNDDGNPAAVKLREKMVLLADTIKDYYALPAPKSEKTGAAKSKTKKGKPPPGPWNLLTSLGNDRGTEDQRAVYALMRNEPERFPLPRDAEGREIAALPESVKQLSKIKEFKITPADVRRIITGKKAPNGAPTSYIIIGRNTVEPVGSIFHLGVGDPLNLIPLGVTLYDPPSVGVEIRWGAGGGDDSSRRYNLYFKTKAFGGASAGGEGLNFNSAEELANILKGRVEEEPEEEIEPELEEPELEEPRARPGLPPRLPPPRTTKRTPPPKAKMSIRR